MTIRKLDIRDYDSVYAMWTRTDGMGLRSLDDSREGIEKFLFRNPNTNFVAVNQGEVVGVILCGHDGRRAYIYHAAVLKDYRKKGIGKKLVYEVLKALKSEEIHRVALLVFKDNNNGNAFWESIGFEERTDLCYRNMSINPENQ